MQKKEQQAQTYFNHWIKEIYFKNHSGGFAFELKHTRDKNYINFNEIKDHQIEALLAVNGDGLVYKIDDSGYGQKPFDCIAFKKCPAYVVIFYPLSAEIIPIEGFILERERSKRKSLTYDRAKAISVMSIDYKTPQK